MHKQNSRKMNIPQQKQGAFIQNGSTFMHEIYLDPALSPKTLISGYSKNQHFAEAADKTYLLKSFMFRVLPVYYDRMLFVDYYQRADPGKDYFIQNRRHLFRVYQTRVDLVKQGVGFDERAFLQFANSLLECLYNGESIAHLKPKWERKSSYQDILRAYFINRKFKNTEDLRNFVTGEINRGMDRAVLHNFEQRYIEMVKKDC